MTKEPTTKPKTPRTTKPKQLSQFRFMTVIGRPNDIEKHITAYMNEGWNVSILSVQEGVTEVIVRGYMTK